MVLTALRGALAFLSQLPVGHDDGAWEAFQATPIAFPLAGYAIGAVLAVPVAATLAVGAPAPTVAAVLVGAVVLVTGVNHADGLADLGDAAAAHGDPGERRAVMQDTAVGVGAVLALGAALVALALAGLAVATLPLVVAVALVVTAEVAAKLAMVALVCLGHASHEGFGAAFVERYGPRSLAVPALATVPTVATAGFLDVALAVATATCLLAGLGVALLVRAWAASTLGGVGGDAIGATNDLARVVALHAGVLAWTVW